MVKVLYFARLRDQLSCDEEGLELAGASTVAQVTKRLVDRGEPWASAFSDPSLLVSVNQTVADAQTPVQEGDEIGFFPPVTGG